MKHVLFTFLLIVILGIVACNENPSDEFKCTIENTVYIPKDAFARFYFKDGTYWIYKDSLSGLFDSMWIENSILVINKHDGAFIDYPKCYERFGYDLISSRYGSSYIVTGNYGQEEINYTTERFGIQEEPSWYSHGVIYKLFMIGNKYDEENGEGGKQVFIDTIVVRNQIYFDVLKIHYLTQSFDYLIDAYYAKGIGLVKFKRTDGTIWELMRYNIE